jgi:uncharacterized protein
MRAFVDTNVFVRFLTGDDPVKAARCLELFERALRGEDSLYTSEAIVGEIIYVLSSKDLYAKERSEIVSSLRPLIELRGLHIDRKQTVLAALERFGATNLGFEDCLAIEHSLRESLDAILSYDRKIGRDGSVPRREP